MEVKCGRVEVLRTIYYPFKRWIDREREREREEGWSKGEERTTTRCM